MLSWTDFTQSVLLEHFGASVVDLRVHEKSTRSKIETIRNANRKFIVNESKVFLTSIHISETI